MRLFELASQGTEHDSAPGAVDNVACAPSGQSEFGRWSALPQIQAHVTVVGLLADSRKSVMVIYVIQATAEQVDLLTLISVKVCSTRKIMILVS